MADRLARWWSEPFWVKRRIGGGPDGDIHADTWTELAGRVRRNTKMVRDASGNEVVSSSGVSMPITTPTIPVDSLVHFGDPDSPRRVITESPHQAVGTPNFYSIDCD